MGSERSWVGSNGNGPPWLVGGLGRLAIGRCQFSSGRTLESIGTMQIEGMIVHTKDLLCMDSKGSRHFPTFRPRREAACMFPPELVNAMPVVTPSIILITGLIPYIIFKRKEANDRKLSLKTRWVELLQRFLSDLYSDRAVVKLFLEIQEAVISRQSSGIPLPKLGIQPASVPDRTPALARLLETVNLTGLMIRLRLVTADDVAKSAIAYVTLILWEHDEVREYVESQSQRHKCLNHPESAFPEIEALVSELRNAAIQR